MGQEINFKTPTFIGIHTCIVLFICSFIYLQFTSYLQVVYLHITSSVKIFTLYIFALYLFVKLRLSFYKSHMNQSYVKSGEYSIGCISRFWIYFFQAGFPQHEDHRARLCPEVVLIPS